MLAAVRYRKIVDRMCQKEIDMYKQIKNCVETMETIQIEKKEVYHYEFFKNCIKLSIDMEICCFT